MGDLSLRVCGLGTTYPGGIRALDDVTFEAQRGLFGLLGPNGAGKSTLMRILATLQEPDAGAVRFGDTDLLREPEIVRRTLGYLPQDFGVYPGVTVREILSYVATMKGLVARGIRDAVVEEILDRVNLTAAADRQVIELSGGMKQRVGIGQALLASPTLLIVDEPTAGLDPAERNRLHHLLAEVATTAVVILSTHLVDEVQSLCAQMAILVGGRIEHHGTPESAIRALEGRVWEARAPRSEQRAMVDRFSPVAIVPAVDHVVLTVVADERPGDGFSRSTPTLAHVYHHAVTRGAR